MEVIVSVQGTGIQTTRRNGYFSNAETRWWCGNRIQVALSYQAKC